MQCDECDEWHALGGTRPDQLGESTSIRLLWPISYYEPYPYPYPYQLGELWFCARCQPAASAPEGNCEA